MADRVIQSNDYAMMVARSATCRSGTTRAGVAPNADYTKPTNIANPSRNLRWKPTHPVSTSTWTVEKS